MPELPENPDILTEVCEKSASEKYLVFSILDRYFCVPSIYIGEIVLFEAAYPLPCVPPYVAGVINRYSIPFALFDIGILLYNKPCLQKKVLVFKESIDRIAFLIDDIEDIVDIPKDELFLTEGNKETNDNTEIVSASFKWKNNDVLVLDVQKIINRVAGDTHNACF